MIANLSERLQLARAAGGRVATAYWLMNRLLRIETYKFCGTTLPAPPRPADLVLPPDYRFICINSADAIAQCEPAVMETLNANNGVTVADTVASGGRVYAIVNGERVMCQQRVEFNRSYTASPYPMDIHVGEGTAFFSYLYTSRAERGRGWARRLTVHITNHLAADGVKRCISHTRATNIGSLATRFRCGWHLVALLYCFKPAKRGYLRRLAASRDLSCELNVESR